MHRFDGYDVSDRKCIVKTGKFLPFGGEIRQTRNQTHFHLIKYRARSGRAGKTAMDKACWLGVKAANGKGISAGPILR